LERRFRDWTFVRPQVKRPLVWAQSIQLVPTIGIPEATQDKICEPSRHKSPAGVEMGRHIELQARNLAHMAVRNIPDRVHKPRVQLKT
jgi:hypothetical protein